MDRTWVRGLHAVSVSRASRLWIRWSCGSYQSGSGDCWSNRVTLRRPVPHQTTLSARALNSLIMFSNWASILCAISVSSPLVLDPHLHLSRKIDVITILPDTFNHIDTKMSHIITYAAKKTRLSRKFGMSYRAPDFGRL